MNLKAACLASVLLAPPMAASARDLPAGTEAMIRVAAAKGDAAVLSIVAGIAREAYPESVEELDALLASLQPPIAAAASAPPVRAYTADVQPAVTVAVPKPRPWKGTLELGGSRLAGVNDVAGAYGSIDMIHAQGPWRHRLVARGDYQQTNGVQTTERYSLGYEPRRTLGGTRYAFGLAQLEHDRALGFDKRYTLGAGVGVGSIEGDGFRLLMDVGPAVRVTETNGVSQESLSARGSLNMRWTVSQRLTLSQENSMFTDREATTAKSLTAVDGQLFGPLKARLSYNLQYEHRPIAGLPASTSTATRASVLYTF